MPSQCNYGIFLNYAPIDGTAFAEPTTGYAISTLFKIRALDYKDEDKPLSYKYSLYL